MRARSLGLASAALTLLCASPAAPVDSVRIAVLPVVVHTEEGHEYLRGGLSDMLRARLERIRGVSVVRVDGEAVATTDVAAARAFANAAGADYVVFGSFTRFGTGASLDMQCAVVNGAEDRDGASTRQVFIHSGTPGEIIPQLDGLAEKLARFALGGAPVSDSSGASNGMDPANDPVIESLTRRVEALERQLLNGDGAAKTELHDSGEAEAAARDEEGLR